MSIQEALDRIEKIALENAESQILNQLICDEIDAIRKELADASPQ